MDWHALGWLALALYAGAELLSILSLLKPGGAPAGAVLRGWGVAVLLGAGLIAQFADLHVTARALNSVPYRTVGGAMSLFSSTRRTALEAVHPAPGLSHHQRIGWSKADRSVKADRQPGGFSGKLAVVR